MSARIKTGNGWLRVFAIAVGLAQSAATALAADPAKPNIVIILADDLGYGDLGFQGCPDIPTPRIDSLAMNGARCTNGYVTGPNCSPTRAGLLTGRYQQRFGHEFNPAETRGERFGLPLSETTIANRLKAGGYVTGIIGKWHLGFTRQYHPQMRGFDEFFGFLGGARPYFPGRGAAIYRGTEAVREREYLTDAFGREAVSFITRHKDRPFLLYLAFNAVHLPKQATDDRLARFASITDPARRNYAAVLAALDEAVGKVLDAVRSERLEEKTLIFFLSDNGGPTRMGGINGSRNAPLRGSKRTTLEGGVHVPFVVQWKGKIPAGTIYDQPVIQLDILPTALAAAGVGIRPEWQLDGVDLVPYLRRQTSGPPHEALFWRQGKQMAIRKGDWKLVRYDRAVEIPGAVSSLANPDVSALRLYDLARDRGEAHDLAAEQPDRVKELLGAWNAWAAQLAEPLWRPQRD